MSAYTSQRWSGNSSRSFPPDLRIPHDDRRELRPGPGDYGMRQNGHGESFHGRESPHPSSPMTSGELPAYNRSVCDSEEYGRHSPVAYPPPPPSDMPQRLYQNYPHSHRNFRQRRPLLHHYNEPPPVRGSPWGPHPSHREFSRYDDRPPYPRSRSPILRKPPHRVIDPNFYERNHRLNGVEVGGESNGPLSDPRLNRSLLDKIQGDEMLSRVLIPFTFGDQVSKEHSYCSRLSTGSSNKEVVSKIKPLTNPLLPRTHLSPRPVLIHLPAKIQILPVISTADTSHNPPSLKRCSWPVDKSYPDGAFSMDLESDEDENTDSDSSVEGVECDLSIITRHSEPSDVLHITGKSDLVNGMESKDESSELCIGEKPVARRSKRLAQTLDDSPAGELADVVQETSGQSTEMNESDVKDTVNSPEVKKTRRKKRLYSLKPTMKKKMKKLAAKQTRSLKNGVSNELKLLLSGDFKPEILTTRSRGESHTLARRQVMEEEIEQHERERIQTARAEIEADEDLESHTHFISTIDTLDTSSEQSATLTSSSITTPSHDQGSSSHDHDSYLDSVSLPCSDSLLDEFSPELIARCKRITSAKSSGDTPLHKVCRNGRMDMVRCLLLVLKVSPNTPDNAGWTPLHEACSNNRLEIAELLLKNGADANASSRDGTRPIHDAIDIGALDVVKLLVEYGADPTAEIGDKSPLELAKSLKTMEIHNFLEPVVKEHQERIKNQKATTVAPTLRRSTRTIIKLSKKLEDDHPPLTLPIDGYSSDNPYFGKELDYPLFYICPEMELSETPFLPVYNFEIVPGKNPRRHNFYLLSELLEALNMSEPELRKCCSEICALEMTVEEFMTNLRHPHYNKHVSVPTTLKMFPKSRKIKFLPACSQLKKLLAIETVNLDD